MSNNSSILDLNFSKYFGKTVFDFASHVCLLVKDGINMSCKNLEIPHFYNDILNINPDDYLKFVICEQIGSFYYYNNPSINAGLNTNVNLCIKNKHLIEKYEDSILKECSLFDLVIDDCNFGSNRYFFPINFSCHTMICYLKKTQENYAKSNPDFINNSTISDRFFLLTIQSMLNTIDSLLLCMERNVDDVANSYALLRTLMETYVNFNALRKASNVNPNIVEDYIYFNKTCLNTKGTKQDILDELNQHFNVTNFSKRFGFGWLKIPNSGLTSGGCNFEDGVNNTSLDSTNKQTLKDQYKVCDSYIHGTLQSYNTDRRHQYDVSSFTGLILYLLSLDIQEIYGNDVIDFRHNNINLLDYLVASVNESETLKKSI